MRLSMKRYIALLRGINVSGKNKLGMSELKDCFTSHGYSDVITYLNSGNVIFSCEEKEEAVLEDELRLMLLEHFNLNVPVFVILQSELENILQNAPEWWGTEDKSIYDNLIFVMPSTTTEEIVGKVGEPDTSLEQIYIYENTIFWSFDRMKYAKANWWKKTARKGIGEMLTIRTANTVKKIVAMHD